MKPGSQIDSNYANRTTQRVRLVGDLNFRSKKNTRARGETPLAITQNAFAKISLACHPLRNA